MGNVKRERWGSGKKRDYAMKGIIKGKSRGCFSGECHWQLTVSDPMALVSYEPGLAWKGLLGSQCPWLIRLHLGSKSKIKLNASQCWVKTGSHKWLHSSLNLSPNTWGQGCTKDLRGSCLADLLRGSPVAYLRNGKPGEHLLTGLPEHGGSAVPRGAGPGSSPTG